MSYSINCNFHFFKSKFLQDLLMQTIQTNRYMKTIFPKADEMVLLDILASSDNNVQTASEKLISMGYTKRDFIPPKTTPRADHEVGAHAATAAKRTGDETIIPLRPKEFTAAEKEASRVLSNFIFLVFPFNEWRITFFAVQAHMKEKYPLIAERIILMALESVNYAEDRAMQILHIVHEEDELHAKKNAATAAAAAGPGGDVALQSLEGASAAEILSAGHDGVDADDR